MEIHCNRLLDVGAPVIMKTYYFLFPSFESDHLFPSLTLGPLQSSMDTKLTDYSDPQHKYFFSGHNIRRPFCVCMDVCVGRVHTECLCAFSDVPLSVTADVQQNRTWGWRGGRRNGQGWNVKSHKRECMEGKSVVTNATVYVDRAAAMLRLTVHWTTFQVLSWDLTQSHSHPVSDIPLSPPF